MKKSIALVIKTDGLEYDDRVRKEILSVKKLFPEISFQIFVMLPENKIVFGTTSYGIPFKSVYIPSRDKYPAANKTLLKAYEFYEAVKNDIRCFDAVWAANVDASFVPLLATNKRIIWDLHELPSIFLGNGIKKSILKYIFGRCRVVLHANPQRETYLESIRVVKDPSKHFALRNYPDFNDFSLLGDDDTYNAFVKWRGRRRCVYLQGLSLVGRAPIESISAVLGVPDLCAVVVGGFDNNIKDQLESKFGLQLNERVFFVGKIPQLVIPNYVKQCFTTLVFYKNTNPNNYYCEANRFYQSVVMGLPVVVGNNPSMKELVDKYGFGVSIDDDGCNVDLIREGLQKVIDDYDFYQKNSLLYREKLMWRTQEPIIAEFIRRLFD